MALIDNLVSYWKCDESSGNLADAHGSNTLTNNNTVAFGTGKINNGADLERGSSHYFSVGDNASLSITSDLSISMWLKVESAPGGVWGLVSKWGDDAPQRGYGLYYFTGTKIRWLTADTTSASARTLEWTSDLGTGTWKHLVLSYDASGSTAACYVDGSSLGAPSGTAYASLADNTANFLLGHFDDNTGYGQFYDGMMDEVGIWNKELSSAEVTQLYNAGAGLAYPFSSGVKLFNLLGIGK